VCDGFAPLRPGADVAPAEQRKGGLLLGRQVAGVDDILDVPEPLAAPLRRSTSRRIASTVDTMMPIGRSVKQQGGLDDTYGFALVRSAFGRSQEAAPCCSRRSC